MCQRNATLIILAIVVVSIALFEVLTISSSSSRAASNAPSSSDAQPLSRVTSVLCLGDSNTQANDEKRFPEFLHAAIRQQQQQQEAASGSDSAPSHSVTVIKNRGIPNTALSRVAASRYSVWAKNRFHHLLKRGFFDFFRNHSQLFEEQHSPKSVRSSRLAVTIMFGTNDARERIFHHVDDFTRPLRELIERCWKAFRESPASTKVKLNLKIIVFAPLPVGLPGAMRPQLAAGKRANESFVWTPWIKKYRLNVRRLDRVIRPAVAQVVNQTHKFRPWLPRNVKVKFVDLNQWLQRLAAEKKKERESVTLLQDDGIHLTSLASEELAETVAREIEKIDSRSLNLNQLDGNAPGIVCDLAAWETELRAARPRVDMSGCDLTTNDGRSMIVWKFLEFRGVRSSFDEGLLRLFPQRQ